MGFVSKGIKGAALYSGVRAVDKIISIVSIIVLARLLSPSDFGMVAYAVTFFVLVQAMSQMGLGEAIIQADRVGDNIDVAWSYGLIRGAILFVLEFSLADVIADFYNEPDLAMVIKVLAFNELIVSLTNMGMIKYVKEGNFVPDFWYSVIGRFVRLFSVLILAIYLESYWAVVCSMLVFSITNLMVSYLICDYRPKINFDPDVFRELFRFGGWLTLVGVVDAFRSVLDKIVLGKLFGVSSLGVYQVSSRISMEIAEDIKSTVSKVLFPLLAKEKDTGSVMAKYQDILAAQLLLVVMSSLFLFVNSEIIVLVVLGDKWKEVIEVIEVLVIVSVLKTIIASSFPVLKSIGDSKNVFVLNFLQGVSFLLIVGYWVGNEYEMMDVLYSIIFSYLVALTYWIILFKRYFPSILETMVKFFVVFVLGLVYCLAAVNINAVFALEPNPRSLGFVIIFFAVCFIFIFKLLSINSYIETVSVVDSKIKGMIKRVW